MTSRSFVSPCARKLGSLVGGVCCLVALAGCVQDSYPEDLRYPLRTDPIVAAVPDKMLSLPDRPGQLPIMSMADLADPFNPLHGDVKSIYDPTRIGEKERAKIRGLLVRLFGTPAHPKVEPLEDETLTELMDELNSDLPVLAKKVNDVLQATRQGSLTNATFSRYLEELKLDNTTLAEGSSIFRAQCLHCHGLPGDGRGPSAHWVNPHPRDYRQGKFKFTSSSQSLGERKPRREDLLRILHNGIDGTSMPAFNLLTANQQESVASYVIHLSLRGQVEYEIMKDYLVEDPKVKESLGPDGNGYELKKRYAIFLIQWRDAQLDKNLIQPGNPYPYTDDELTKSVKSGQEFFLGTDGGCIACHPNYGRQGTFSYDDWGTLARRANLTAGIFRGGRRPLDLYWRVYGGINGAGMAEFKKYSNKDKPKEDKIWDVVNFLQVLPYPKMREKYGLKFD